jgi:hypothetical protein
MKIEELYKNGFFPWTGIRAIVARDNTLYSQNCNLHNSVKQGYTVFRLPEQLH